MKVHIFRTPECEESKGKDTMYRKLIKPPNRHCLKRCSPWYIILKRQITNQRKKIPNQQDKDMKKILNQQDNGINVKSNPCPGAVG